MPKSGPMGGGALEPRQRWKVAAVVAHFIPSKSDEYSTATLAVNTADPQVVGDSPKTCSNLLAEQKL